MNTGTAKLAIETPLAKVKEGAEVSVVRLEAGCGMTQRVLAMGILPGAILRVLRNEYKGQMIILVAGTKLVLGRGMADKIIVKYGSR